MLCIAEIYTLRCRNKNNVLWNHLILSADALTRRDHVVIGLMTHVNGDVVSVKLFRRVTDTFYLRLLMETPGEMFILYSCQWKLSMGLILPKFRPPKVRSQRLS